MSVQVPRVMHVLGGEARSGIGLHVLSLLRCMKLQGVEPQAAFLQDNSLLRRAREEGLPVIETYRRSRYDVGVILRLARLLKQEKVDLVHTHATSGSFYGRYAAHLARVPGIVTTVHAFSWEVLRNNRRLNWLTYVSTHHSLAVHRRIDRVVAVSSGVKQELVRNGLCEAKISVIPCGLDWRELNDDSADRSALRASMGCPEQTFLVGLVGRLVRLKNPELFIHIGERLVREGHDSYFVLIGDGRLREELEEKVRSSGFAHRILFTGWRHDAKQLINALDVLVVCSTTETGPLSAIEAMACGVPVVTSPVGMMPDLIESGKNGYMVDAPSEEGFVAALRNLAEHPEISSRMGELARATVRKGFDLEKTSQSLAELYREILRSKDIA